jgi:hypothetical protein
MLQTEYQIFSLIILKSMANHHYHHQNVVWIRTIFLSLFSCEYQYEYKQRHRYQRISILDFLK